jgi:hypothetical protein
MAGEKLHDDTFLGAIQRARIFVTHANATIAGAGQPFLITTKHVSDLLAAGVSNEQC